MIIQKKGNTGKLESSKKRGRGSKAEEKEAIIVLSTQQKYKHCVRKNNGNVTRVYSIKHLDMTSRGRQWFMWVICSKQNQRRNKQTKYMYVYILYIYSSVSLRFSRTSSSVLVEVQVVHVDKETACAT